MKLLYVGMTYDYGDKSRGFSFEHYNFYCPLKSYCKKHNWSFIHYDFMQRCSELGQDLMTQELYEFSVKERPDYLFAVLFDFHKDPRHEVFNQISSLGTVTVHWFCDDHWRFEKYSSKIAPNFDFICTTANSAVPKYEKLGMAHKVIKTQWACNHELYIPYDIDQDINISFVGQPHGNRVDVLSKIKQTGLNVEVYGYGWQNRPRVPFHQMVRLFSRSKINLNLSNSSTLIGQQIKGRNFEIPGCRGFLLTGNAENLECYYEDDKEIVIFNSIEELIEKARYYLIHEQERRIIAAKGYERTLSEHTWHHRYDFIFKYISSNYNTSGDIEKLEENLLLINELRNNGLLEDAYSTLEGLIHIYPANPDLLNLQGELKFQIGQREEAKSLFLNLVRLFPENSIILNNLGIILRSEGNIEEGKSYLIKALTVDPDNRSATANLADILVSLGKYEDGAYIFSSYLERNPDDKEIYDCLETIKMLAAGAEEERHIQEKISEINELRCIGFLDEALSCMPDLISIYPDSPEILNLEGELLFQAGHMEKAKKSFLSLLERFPEYGQTLNNLGVINLNEGQMDKALYYYKKAIEVNRDDYAATINLTDLLVTLHKYKEAENILSLYHERNPHVEEISSVLENLRISFINQENPLVSVIIPCYNQAEYLSEAVESVVNQTYKNWECIIVNDGSPDNTSDVARQLIAAYPDKKIQLLEKSNGGLADARNAGVKEAKGIFILPLDSDDKIDPDYLSETAHILINYPEFSIVYVDEKNFGTFSYIHCKEDFFTFEQLLAGNMHDYCSLYRKEVWSSVGGYSPAMYLGAEDWNFWIGAAKLGFKSYHVKKPLFLYRNRPNTMVSETLACLNEVKAHIVLHYPDLFGNDLLEQVKRILREMPEKNRKKLVATRKKHPDNIIINQIYELIKSQMSETDLLKDAPPNLVSVIIPCYNQAHFLQEAVESVVNQTFEDWEIIIVNDGSTDNTKEIAIDLINTYPEYRIHLIDRPNSGIVNARNTGISAAKGDYILPLDADDSIAPEMLEKCVNILNAYPDIAIAYTDVQEFGALHRMVPSIEYNFNVLCHMNYITCTALFRRKAWQSVGGYSMTMKNGYEDWDFWIACGEKGFYGKRIGEPLFYYRKKPESRNMDAINQEMFLKAQIVLNHFKLYSPCQVAWAKGIMAYDPSVLSIPDRPYFIPQFLEPLPDNIKSILEKYNKKTRILFTMYGWNETGGGTTFPRACAKKLANMGMDVAVFYGTANHPVHTEPYYMEYTVEDGVHLYGIYNRPSVFLDVENPEREIHDPECVKLFTEVLDEFKPDLVHFHNFLGLSFGIGKEAKKRGLVTLYTPHNYHLIDPTLYLFRSDLSLWRDTDFFTNSELSEKYPALKDSYRRRINAAKELLNNHIDITLAVSRRVRELLVS
ncbi:MAG: glycosyltransferase, partial [Candidatus Eremiobacterota bacterium]